MRPPTGAHRSWPLALFYIVILIGAGPLASAPTVAQAPAAAAAPDFSVEVTMPPDRASVALTVTVTHGNDTIQGALRIELRSADGGRTLAEHKALVTLTAKEPYAVTLPAHDQSYGPRILRTYWDDRIVDEQSTYAGILEAVGIHFERAGWIRESNAHADRERPAGPGEPTPHAKTLDTEIPPLRNGDVAPDEAIVIRMFSPHDPSYNVTGLVTWMTAGGRVILTEPATQVTVGPGRAILGPALLLPDDADRAIVEMAYEGGAYHAQQYDLRHLGELRVRDEHESESDPLSTFAVWAVLLGGTVAGATIAWSIRRRR